MVRSCHCAAAVLTALLPAIVHAESLWDRRESRSAYLFVDTRARRVGDLLTIVVRETTDIDNRDQRALDKSSETGGVFKFQGQWTDGAGTHSANADFDGSATSKRKFDGRAQYTSERDFEDRMTVTVTDVLPNGNLVVEGTRRRVVTGEERVLRVSGVVRPIDIGAGNVVQSQFVANFQVSYEGKGPESRFSNQGWMSRFVNRVWPF